MGGCGADSGAGASSRSTKTTASAAVAKTVQADLPAVEAGVPAVPGSAAVARGAQLDALVDSYEPVTAEASSLVAAEALRTYARTNDAPKEQVEQYAARVNVELQRTSVALAAARQRVAAQATPNPSVRRMQQLLLEAITARATSVVKLKRLVIADADPLTTHERRVALRDAWRAAWDSSVRAGREATTSMQDTREALGLAAGPEDGIR